MHRILAIDPSVNVTGYAIYVKQTLETWRLQTWGLYVLGHRERWQDRAHEMSRWFLKKYPRLADVVIEFPAFQAGAVGTYASRNGDTLKLAYVCGLFGSYTPYLATPQMWKGQVPKEVTIARFERLFKLPLEQKQDHNAVDAVMLGHWYITTIRNEPIDSDTRETRRDDRYSSPKS